MNNKMSLAECLRLAEGTQCMTIKDGALEEIPALLKRYFAGNNSLKKIFIFIAADKNTFAAAGAAVEETVRKAGIVPAGCYFFDERIHAEYRHVETLKNEFERALEKFGLTKDNNQSGESPDSILVPVAVGSGTINDLVKRAAAECNLPYLCVPTAASVDGYTAYGAALLYQGFKQTMPCEAPLAVVADSTVLAAAPPYLSSSGFGDLAGKIIAGSDWIIADKIFALDRKGELAPGLSKIENTAWDMVQPSLWDNIKRSVNAAKGDREAVGTLFEALGITGFALQYMKDSRSVSGSEHMYAHVWEMENLSAGGIPVTHGHKVAMGTLAASAFTECLFAEKPALVKNTPSWPEREAEIRRMFSGLKDALPSLVKTAEGKFIKDTKQLKKLREGILDRWNVIRNAVFEQLPPYAELRNLLCDSGCPVKPEGINLSKKQVLETAIKAHMIRKRFTVLDLAYEAGVFDKVLKRMEASDYLSG